MQLEEVAPKLIIFGEEPQRFQGENEHHETLIWLAKSLEVFQELEDTATLLKLFLENMLIQLGSLCSEHTRKPTILQGMILQSPIPIIFLTCMLGLV